MIKALALARVLLVDTARDRASLLNLVFLPVLFTFLVGIVFGGGWGSGGELTVAVADLDDSEISRLVLGLMPATFAQRPVSTADEGLNLVRKGGAAAAVTIPPGFGQAVKSLEPAVVKVEFHDRIGAERGALAAAVSTAVLRVRSDAAAAHVAMSRSPGTVVGVSDAKWDEVFWAAEQGWTEEPLVTVEHESVEGPASARAQIPQRPIDQASVGFLVMFVMMTTAFGAGEILQEKKAGTWGRLLSTPTPRWSILGGKLLGVAALGVLQCAILVGAGQFLFGVEWGSSPLWVGLVLVCLILAATGLGLMIAGFAKTYAQVVAFANIIVMPTSMMAGVFWPFEVMPKAVQKVAQALPQRYAVAALIDLIVGKTGPSSGVIVACLVLLGFAGVFLAIGMSRLRYE
ncbi:MAG: ABC transporter permease [Firmicutes bacterium]|nr:ABC transporter permease [Bacillota bacterium]